MCSKSAGLRAKPVWGHCPPLTALTMHVLYLDESGTHQEATYFVLGGLAVFEREIHWYGQDLDALQADYFPEETGRVFFHAARLRVRKGAAVEPPWDRLTNQQRIELKDKVYDIIRNRYGVLFGCAIEKRLAVSRNEDPYEMAFEDLVSRFDQYVSRVNRNLEQQGGEQQRGLIVLAESNYQRAIGELGQRLRARGTRWRSLRNVADVPLFAPARDTRLLQYADFCANAIYGRYHSKLTGDFDRIALKFDREESVVHGLAHLTTDSLCSCIACFSRLGR